MLPPFPRSSLGGPRGPQTRRRPVLVDPLVRQVDVGRDSVRPAPREVAARERVGVLVGDVGVAAEAAEVTPPGGGHLVQLSRGQRDGLGGRLGGIVCQGRSRNERTQRCADQKLLHDVPLSGCCRRTRSSELPPGSEHHALDAPIVSPAIKRTRMHRTYGVRAMLPKKYARERPGGGFDRVAFWVQGSLWRLQPSRSLNWRRSLNSLEVTRASAARRRRSRSSNLRFRSCAVRLGSSRTARQNASSSRLAYRRSGLRLSTSAAIW